MAFGKDHELHGRRLGRNIGVGGVLIGFVVLVFGLTIVKVGLQGPEGGLRFDSAPGAVAPVAPSGSGSAE